MGPLKSIIGLSQDVGKSEKAKETKKVDKEHRSDKKVNGQKTAVNADVAQISSAGREMLLLKMEAQKYVDDVGRAETLSLKEIESIKEKIAANYYFDPEVIDKVVDKIIAMPNFNRF